MQPCDTWVCVADGECARFYRCDGGRDLEPILNYAVPRGASASFCGRLAGQLDRAARDHLFEHLVLVGPVAFLRELEGSLNDATRDLVVVDFMSRGVHCGTPRLAATHLSDVLPI